MRFYIWKDEESAEYLEVQAFSVLFVRVCDFLDFPVPHGFRIPGRRHDRFDDAHLLNDRRPGTADLVRDSREAVWGVETQPKNTALG